MTNPRQYQIQKQKADLMDQHMKNKMMAKQLENSSKFKQPLKSTEMDIAKPQNRLPVQTVIGIDSTKQIYYAVRSRPLNPWSPCEILEEKFLEGQKIYVVKFLDTKPNTGVVTAQVSGKHIAMSFEKSVLSVGKRVIANFTRTSTSNPISGLKQFVPGVVGETLTKSNKGRYLVFGDDGNVEYMTKTNVFPVMDQSKDVWEDIHINLKQFMKEYMTRETSKQRP